MSAGKKRVLFVCMGNICRSPAAEGVMLAQAEAAGVDIEIESAGTIGMHAGTLPDARMRAAAAKRGYDLRSRARKVVAADLERFDLILAMDDDNMSDVLALVWKVDQRAKVRLFCEFCREHKEKVVPDPYYGGAAGFEGVLDLLEDGCRGLVEELRR